MTTRTATHPRGPALFAGLFQIKGQIVNPPRSSSMAAALLIGLILILGLAGTNTLGGGSFWLLPMVYLMVPLAVASRGVYVVHFSIFLVFCYFMSWFPSLASSPFNQLIALSLYGYAVVVIPSLRQSVGWVRLGKFDRTIWLLIAAAGILSSAALIAWVKWVNPDLSRYAGLIPGKTTGLVLWNGLFFCSLNAAEEEIIWRGMIMEALDSAFGPGILSIVIQAASFATAHYLNGFPNGITGSLIVFACGLMLGIIRRKSRGIAAPWLAHMASDFTIYCLVVISLGSPRT